MKKKFILTINPGSTSTKIALFEGDAKLFEKTLRHSSDELGQFEDMISQYSFRKDLIVEAIDESDYELSDIAIIVGRGGALRPMASGTYAVNQLMKDDLIAGAARTGHASNLGGLIADDLAQSIEGADVYIADPPVVDELSDIARVAGHPNFYRESIFHALNQKAVARRHAKAVGKKYEELNLIVAHLGGGISVGAHEKGRVVDVNDALDGDGPMSPERSGTVPAGQLLKLCFSGEYEKNEARKMLVGKGGVSAHLGTSDIREVEKRIEEGDSKAQLIYDAMIYQVARSIGSQYTVLDGEIDGIIITGGIAHSKLLVEKLTKRISKIATVYVYPGEDEMEALALNGKLILEGELTPIVY
jgi:butyrate kinase